jgi:anti-anti-sigma factor
MQPATNATAPRVPGAELTIVHAEAERQALLARLADDAAWPPLDLSHVTAIDSAGVQLLLALQRSLRERGQPWRVAAASEAVRGVLATYGLLALVDGQQETTA